MITDHPKCLVVCGGREAGLLAGSNSIADDINESIICLVPD